MLIGGRVVTRIREAGGRKGGECVPMALGDQIGEGFGRITGTRVITPLGTQQEARIEVSFQGNGTLLGQDITNIGTYVQTLRPGGTLYGEGDVLYITGDGQSAHWRGFGVGRPTGAFPAGHFAVCGSVETESQTLGRLNEIATVIEYDVDQEGNYRYTTWEWR
jgi:hypothetical protein